MPTTSNLALPYPDLAAAPNVPEDIQALAVALDDPTILPKRTRGSVSGATTDASGLIVVTHGLGVTPTIVLHSTVGAVSTNEKTLRTVARTSTTFTVAAYYNSSQAISNAGWSFDWICEA